MLQTQLASLQSDFQYNLELLDGRDTELAAYDAALREAVGQAEQKDTLIAAMQQAISEAEAGGHSPLIFLSCSLLTLAEHERNCCPQVLRLKLYHGAALMTEHAARARAEGSLQQQRRALLQELDDIRSAAARELEQAQQAAAAQCSNIEARLQEECRKHSELERQHAESGRQMEVWQQLLRIQQ